MEKVITYLKKNSQDNIQELLFLKKTKEGAVAGGNPQEQATKSEMLRYENSAIDVGKDIPRVESKLGELKIKLDNTMARIGMLNDIEKYEVLKVVKGILLDMKQNWELLQTIALRQRDGWELAKERAQRLVDGKYPSSELYKENLRKYISKINESMLYTKSIITPISSIREQTLKVENELRNMYRK